ncbi:MAG: CopD family protein [Candidatus Rokubacteria bacterium]|nr:CopD family protein [Candidatus Rokubacteria bacterium]
MNLLILWLHVLGVVAWMGGVMYQSHVLWPLARRGAVATVAEAAARGRIVGWIALGLVVLTGFYNVTTLGPLERVMQSGAALLLAGKFALVLVAVALAVQRDWTQVTKLRIAVTTGEDPAPILRTIAWLDRLTLVLALVIVYLGLAISQR